MSVTNREKISVFWFRRDLRLEDNTGLMHALDGNFPVIPIFIFDPNILLKLGSKKDARVEFIYNQLQVLKLRLEQKDSSLIILHCTPEEAFKKLVDRFDIKAVFSNRDYEPSAIQRDKSIASLLQKKNISFYQFKDQVIFEGHEILKQDQTPYKVFTPFKNKWVSKFSDLKETLTKQEIRFDKFLKSSPFTSPTLSSLGFEKSGMRIPENHVKTSTIKKYEDLRNFPAQDGTSKLGIHFRFGTISIREKASRALQISETFLNELIWRDFYSYILQHFPYVSERAFNKKYEQIPWLNNESEFRLWCTGNTGYPIVDAGMRELNQTGFMHNRVRMITASFLTKHLLIDWRWGEAYFASKLLDYDLASNNGGWQWAAGTGTDAQPYFRVFNPESQAQKFDKNNDYIRKWIPDFDQPSYARPVVEHKAARIRAIETYKAVVSNY